MKRANADVSPDLPDQVPETTALERLVQTVVVFLTFQSRVQLEGDSNFARDVQSLLFQLSLHVLSPKLVAPRLREADAYLMHALFVHAKIAWTDQPAHQNYLLSTLFEHTGQYEDALALLGASLSSSSPDEHDFVTKAQTYWSMLIEGNRLDDAKAFILGMYRRAASKDLLELQAMLDDTYAFENRRVRAS